MSATLQADIIPDQRKNSYNSKKDIDTDKTCARHQYKTTRD